VGSAPAGADERVNDVRLTHIGGPTVLIEVDGWRLLTDPTFDAPGRRYSFGWGSASRKLVGPAIAVSELPPIDAVLLTHDHHGDNLDAAGRALLPSAGVVITTASGAERLGGGARGLETWDVDIAILHLGGVRFPVTGPVRNSMTGRDAVELCRLIGPRVAIPIHYEGWKHFRQGRDALEREFARAPDDIRRSIRWLPLGVGVELAA
jgi:L-ascorbate metabolism protein UlaG (beta-lactamase superfamily)